MQLFSHLYLLTLGLLSGRVAAQYSLGTNASLPSGTPSSVISYAPDAPTPAFMDVTGSSTYMNPILNTTGADPWVIRDGDYYYMTYTTNDNITMLRSKALT